MVSMTLSPAMVETKTGHQSTNIKTAKLRGAAALPTANKPAPCSTATNIAEQLDDQERKKYVKGAKLGSGQYADVFSAHLISDPKTLVAIKKIKVGPEVAEFGISYDSLREIKFLQELAHPNIIRLHLSLIHI